MIGRMTISMAMLIVVFAVKASTGYCGALDEGASTDYKRYPSLGVSVKSYEAYSSDKHMYVVDDEGIIFQQLKDSQMFEDVHSGYRTSSLHAWMKLKKSAKQKGGVATGLVVGLTVGLFPQEIDFDYTLFVVLENDGRKIFSSHYDVRHEASGNILNMNLDSNLHRLSRELADLFIADVRKHEDLLDKLNR